MVRRDRHHDEEHHTTDRIFDEDDPVAENGTTSDCPECDGRVRTNSAEPVCRECGLIIEGQRIDDGPE